MKNILTLSVLFIVVMLTACKKTNEIAKPQIADIEFEIDDLVAPGDTVSSLVSYSNSIILKSNFTWTIDFGGAISNGTYTWTPTSNQQGEVKFTILVWTDFITNPDLSNKLKSALLAVNHCGYSLQTPSFAHFMNNNYQAAHFPYLRTYRK